MTWNSLDKDWEAMDPSFEIAPIVIKYVRGEDLSPEESARLRQWISEGKGREELIDSFRNDPGYIESQLNRLRQVDTASIWSKVQERTQPLAPSIPHHSRRRPWLAAASIIILLGAGGAWLWYFNHRSLTAVPPMTTAVAASDVQPGGNKAILTLTDGRRIDLATTANGVLANQGNSKVALVSNGRLAYSRDKNIHDKPVAAAFNTLSTPKAGQFSLRLPDGTQVWLNNASVLRYPVAFSGPDRTVELAGEAYFDVARDAGHPFKVFVHKGAAAANLSNLSSYAPPVPDDGGSVEVLGTSFNIMAYTDEPSERATVVDGSVRVAVDNQNAVLQAAQQSSLDTRGKLRVIPDVNVQEVIAWKNGYFHFDHASVEEAMRQIARWYDIKVVYQGQMPETQFDGRIQRDLPLSDILKGIENEHVHFKLEGRQLTVTP